MCRWLCVSDERQQTLTWGSACQTVLPSLVSHQPRQTRHLPNWEAVEERKVSLLPKQAGRITVCVCVFHYCSNETVHSHAKGVSDLPLATTTSVLTRHTILHRGDSTRTSYSACRSMRSSPWRQWWEPAVFSTFILTAKVKMHKWTQIC